MSEHNSEFSRRKFISTSLGTLAAAGLAGAAPGLALGQTEAVASGTDAEVLYRTLGKTGLKMPIVSMGAGHCNDPRLVQASFEKGVRLFDTAAVYQYGRNEQMVGNALAKAKVREQAIIATKIFTPDQRRGLDATQSKKKIMQLVEGCLKRLRTDYIDILYLHAVADVETVTNEATLENMAKLKEQGKVKAIGTSTHTDAANIINATVATGVYDVVLTHINFTMADDTDLLAAIANAASKGLGVVAMKTQAGGGRFPNPDTLREYDSATINRACLKWVLQNENITTAIPGYDNYEHMNLNFEVASSLEYTDSERAFLSDNSIKLGMGFCRQCKGCLSSCPKNSDVPTLMRTHMYAAQYANFELARRTLDGIPADSGFKNCADCSACTAQCVNSVDIPTKIDELKLIYA